MQVTHRETFADERLAGHVHEGYVSLIGKDVAKIWTPDTFFRNAIDSHISGAIQPNTYARIYPDGKVLVSRRIEISTACPGVKDSLRSNGNATCPLGIASYGYQKTDLEYFLTSDNVMVAGPAASFLGEYGGYPLKLTNVSTDRKEVTTSSGSQYMSVQVNFNIQPDSP